MKGVVTPWATFSERFVRTLEEDRQAGSSSGPEEVNDDKYVNLDL